MWRLSAMNVWVFSKGTTAPVSSSNSLIVVDVQNTGDRSRADRNAMARIATATTSIDRTGHKPIASTRYRPSETILASAARTLTIHHAMKDYSFGVERIRKAPVAHNAQR